MYKILTDIPGKAGRFWGDNSTYVGPYQPPTWMRRWLGEGLAHNLTGAIAALRLFARRRHCQGVVTDGGASGMLFAWLQTLCPWGRKRHVITQCIWDKPPTRLKHWFKVLRVRLAARSVHRFGLWASHEVEDFANFFDLPRWQMEYVPFHHTLHDFTYEIRDDGYVFAGGNSDRDYRTLVEAVRHADIPTWLALTQRQLLVGVEIPPHVRVEATTPAGFRQAMAAAKLNVIPMRKDTLRSAGQQTCLNAMLMGKPTIAVGRRWAIDFITDGEDGLIVDYEDPQGLLKAIRWVYDHPEAAQRMGERARQRAAWFTTERCMRHLHDLALDRVCEDCSPPSGNARPNSDTEVVQDARTTVSCS